MQAVHLVKSNGMLAGLLHPSATVMDLNVGAALWMAARAEDKSLSSYCQPKSIPATGTWT